MRACSFAPPRRLAFRPARLAAPTRWNIGYLYISHKALPAMLHWQQMCIDHPTLWDQNLFKDILKIGGLSYERRGAPTPPALQSKRLFLGYNRTIAIGILPVSTFCSGHTYFIQRMPQRRGLQPFTVHTTFQAGPPPASTFHTCGRRMPFAQSGNS